MSHHALSAADWSASAQEAVFDEPESTQSSSTTTLSLSSSLTKQIQTFEISDITFPATTQRKNRFRSMSHSLLSRRPRPQSLSLMPEQDDADPGTGTDHAPRSPRGRHGHSQSTDVTSSSARVGGSPVKGIFRRASMSIRRSMANGKRASVAHADDIDEDHVSNTFSPPHLQTQHRPGTSHSTWHRLRQAASFRHLRGSHGAADAERPRFDEHLAPIFTPLPKPGSGAAPPVIPQNTGAAAKASVAAQNELLGLDLARQVSPPSMGLHNKWLKDFGLHRNQSRDRESGISINVANAADSELDLAVDDIDATTASLEQDANISRVNFISDLPVELAIQVLAYLDAPALAATSLVCRRWAEVTRNQHVWKDAFLRLKTGTYATSEPVRPGAELGIPAVRPGMDWKQVYRVKEQLDLAWKTGNAKPVYLNGHLDSIYCLQFDENKIITGSRDKTIRVWDMHTLSCRLVIGPPDVVNDNSILYDAEGQPVHHATLKNKARSHSSVPACVTFPMHHDKSILCLQYDDRLLVTGSSDGTCILYSVKSGYRPIRRLQQHTAAVLDLAFDDDHIVTCSKDASICVWNRRTGDLLRQLTGHTGPVNAVQLRGNTIVSCSGDFRVKLWNVDTGKNIREFVGHTKGLACCQFSEDGRFVASAGNDKVIRIWDANTGECIRKIPSHDNLVRSLHVDSVTGRLVSGSYDTDIKVFDMETGRALLEFPKWHSSWVLGAKSDYRRIVSTGQDPKILIMDFGGYIDGIDVLQSKPRPVESKAGYI